ncbi:N/A [soil metagenome]
MEDMAEPYFILTDTDVAEHLTMSVAVAKMEDAFRELAAGTLAAPPRFRVEAPNGALVFTAGAAMGAEQAIGFRVYDTFSSAASTEQTQLVVVFNSETGRFKGVVIGAVIGAMRTGAIGGVAIKYLARPDAQVLAVVGAGFQARTQIRAAMAVRSFKQVYVSSRTRSSAEKFRDEVVTEFGVPCEATDAQTAVQNADVVLCATTSRTPVLETAWLKAGTHINQVGPKGFGASELPASITDIATLIATDSVAQTRAYDKPHFVTDESRFVGLESVVVGDVPGRLHDDNITLFCSVGLAGTEVVLANHLLNLKRDFVG